MKNWFLYLYIGLAIINILAEFWLIDWLIIASKPLLLVVLSCWFYLAVRPMDTSFKRLILVGLLFSLGGDVLLLGVEQGPQNPSFFIFGLASFLVAQLAYAIAFLRYPIGKAGIIRRQPLYLLLFLLYLILLLSNLWIGIPADLKVPVTIYAMAITLMVIAAFNLKSAIPSHTFWFLFGGALLFMLSDSLIAINKFGSPLLLARVSIMLTYLIGQFFIARSAVQIINQWPNKRR